MADGFESFVKDSQQFLTDLAGNNTRDWFVGQKPRYDRELKVPAGHLLTALEGRLTALSGGAVKGKLFRPQRDLRFSKDKTPYHTHLHLAWMPPAGHAPDAGWFFGVSPDYVTAGVGIMAFSGDQITAYRDAVAGRAGAELAGILAKGGFRLDAPELKRLPSGFAKDHARADLLRRKSLTVWRDGIEGRLCGDLPTALEQMFREMHPVAAWLRQNT